MPPSQSIQYVIALAALLEVILTPFKPSKPLCTTLTMALILLSPAWANADSKNCSFRKTKALLNTLVHGPTAFDKNLKEIKKNLSLSDITQPQADQLVKKTLDEIQSGADFLRFFEMLDPPQTTSYYRIYEALGDADVLAVLRRVEEQLGPKDWTLLERILSADTKITGWNKAAASLRNYLKYIRKKENLIAGVDEILRDRNAARKTLTSSFMEKDPGANADELRFLSMLPESDKKKTLAYLSQQIDAVDKKQKTPSYLRKEGDFKAYRRNAQTLATLIRHDDYRELSDALKASDGSKKSVTSIIDKHLGRMYTDYTGDRGGYSFKKVLDVAKIIQDRIADGTFPKDTRFTLFGSFPNLFARLQEKATDSSDADVWFSLNLLPKSHPDDMNLKQFQERIENAGPADPKLFGKLKAMNADVVHKIFGSKEDYNHFLSFPFTNPSWIQGFNHRFLGMISPIVVEIGHGSTRIKVIDGFFSEFELDLKLKE